MKKIKRFEKIYKEIQEPKEYAKYLFDKFKSKEVALLVVYELIIEIDSLHNKGLKDIHQTLKSPKKLYKDVINPEKIRLETIRQELLII